VARQFGTVERAVRNFEEDALDRRGFVDRLVDALVVPTTSTSTGVVVGVVGSWGSGKSSILNLVEQTLRERHEKAIILRFDPWLVSGRDDLIAVFLRELSAAIGAETENAKRFVAAIDALNTYSQYVTPLIDLVSPMAGALLKGGIGTVANAAKPNISLTKSREIAAKAIQDLGVPVVVLVDELDRVEDAEVRTMAQLVRSVADFEGISYLLAYDPERVAEALGDGAGDPHGRGRSYLEKIVQLPIALPLLMENELRTLLASEITVVHEALDIAPGHFRIGEHERLIDVIVPGLVSTPRDVKRLVGIYQVFAGMLRNEVDLADVLGFSALQTKAPRVVERIRLHPEMCVVDPLSFEAHQRRMEPAYDPLSYLIKDGDGAAAALLLRLFPALSGQGAIGDAYPDSIGRRQGLMTALRLGALPGAASRTDVEDLVVASRSEAAGVLQAAYDKDAMGSLFDRFTQMYGGLVAGNDVNFWLGLADFLSDPNATIESQLVLKRDIAEAFAAALTDVVHRRPDHRKKAQRIFQLLAQSGDLSLVPTWLHAHVFAHGIFGLRGDGGRWFLSAEDAQREVLTACSNWNNMLLANVLLPKLLDASPLLLMIDAQQWSEIDRDHFGIHGGEHIERLAMLFFGGTRIVSRETLESLCGYDRFIGWIEFRESQGGVPAGLEAAFERAKRAPPS